MIKTAFAALLFLLACQVASADQACTDQCWLTWDDCSANCGDWWSCNACDEQRDQCLAYCDSCPHTRDYSVTTLLSAQQTGARQCMEEYAFAGHGFWFYQYFAQYRVTNYRDTTACDGTTTTTVLSSSTYSSYCLKKSPFFHDYCSPYSPYIGGLVCGF
jgi:hypothetical protein